jgi:hypothetical protein
MEYGHQATLEVLINNGASIHEKDIDGKKTILLFQISSIAKNIYQSINKSINLSLCSLLDSNLILIG